MDKDFIAIVKAKELLEENGHNFQDTFNKHLCFGFVISRRDAFAMCYFPERDTLHVTIATGNLERLADYIPSEAKFIRFARFLKNGNNETKTYSADRMRKLMSKMV